jgi:hypothetical protein
MLLPSNCDFAYCFTALNIVHVRGFKTCLIHEYDTHYTSAVLPFLYQISAWHFLLLHDLYRFGCLLLSHRLCSICIQPLMSFIFRTEVGHDSILLNITTDNSFCNYRKHVFWFVLVTNTMNVLKLPFTFSDLCWSQALWTFWNCLLRALCKRCTNTPLAVNILLRPGSMVLSQACMFFTIV